MRARFFAFLILIFLIGVPVGAYYYFTQKQIASITISTGTGVVFVTHLSGTFGVDGLPLADRALSYTQDCVSQCVVVPILPARYTLTLTSSGQTDISDTLIVSTADQLTRSYTFTHDIILRSVGNITDVGNISSGSTWHMRTETGSFVIDSDKITEDIRFTDAIDLTPEIRLGYIDKNDTAKLSIGNFVPNQSVLVRLDRTTGEGVTVRKGIDIGALLLYRGRPAYVDSTGQVYSITY